MSKKGENIYKRKDNQWEARYIKGYSFDGKIIYGYCYEKTYREAKEKVNEVKAALINGQTIQRNSRLHLSSICDQWLQLNRTKVKESSYVKYSAIDDKHIKPAIGGYLIQAIDSLTIEQFGYDLLTEKALAPKTVRDILSLLKTVLQYAHKTVSGIDLVEVTYPKLPKQEMRILNREEQDIFVQYLLNDPDPCKFGVLFSLLTGLRIGEICALKWRNISLPDGTVSVSSTMQRLKNSDGGSSSKTSIRISTPKSDSSLRIIPLSDYLIAICNQWTWMAPEAYVLTGDLDRFIEPRTLQYRLAKYTKECNLDGVHYHVLRHTFATRCVEVDFEIKSLSEVLGHSSPRITLERYVHSSMELKRDNMKKLSAIGY